MANAFSALLRSRKFLLALLDVVISLVTYLVGLFGSPETQDMVLQIIGLLQPLFITLIGAIALEDAAQKRSGTFSPPAK